jgi:hypothetical protein
MYIPPSPPFLLPRQDKHYLDDEADTGFSFFLPPFPSTPEFSRPKLQSLSILQRRQHQSRRGDRTEHDGRETRCARHHLPRHLGWRLHGRWRNAPQHGAVRCGSGVIFSSIIKMHSYSLRCFIRVWKIGVIVVLNPTICASIPCLQRFKPRTYTSSTISCQNTVFTLCREDW